LNYKYPKNWTFPKIVKYKILKKSTPEDIRLSTQGERITNGGWHFSYFFGIDNIIDKIKNFSHQEFNNELYTNDIYIEDCIKNGKYIFSDVNLEYVDIETNTNLPKNYNLLTAYKPKCCFLITSYCDTTLKVEILNECIDNLKTISNNDICVHAHYPLGCDIQKQVNFYLYDKSNPVLKYPEKYITYWKQIHNLTLHIYTDDYGYAVLQQWKRGFDFLKNIYDYIIILNYDVNITKKLLQKIENKSNYDGCIFLHENGSVISPLSVISTKTNLFEKITLDEYKIVNGFAENFVEYLYRDSNCYRFNFNEYKDDFFTSLDFNGKDKIKENLLNDHYSPYDIFKFDNFDIFIGENNNFLNILFYNLNKETDVKIYYEKLNIYENIISNYVLINTNIDIAQLDINKLIIIADDVELKIDNSIINFCKILI
jgi:hypothetical protein